MNDPSNINIYGSLNIHRPKLFIPGEALNFNCLLPTGIELFNYLETKDIVRGIYELFRNPQVYQYNQEFRMKSFNDAVNYYNQLIPKQIESKVYVYHIINSKYNQYLGLIHNISYLCIREQHPDLMKYIDAEEHPWMLEFFISPQYWGINIMVNMVHEMIQIHVHQGYRVFYALINVNNIRCIKFVEKFGFKPVRDGNDILLVQNKKNVIGAIYKLTIG